MTIKNPFFTVTVNTCKKDVLNALHDTDPEEEAYEIMAKNYKTLCEAEAATKQSRDKVTSTILSSVSTALLMGMIMHHEDTGHIITTKAINWLPKGR